jgi:hypothetical protein
MSAPTLTFTPAMFHASKAGIKDITRRLAQVSRQNDIDQLAAAIADDDEMAFWKSHTHLCAHQPGQIKPMVTTWAVPSIYDTMKPSDIGAVLTPKFIWFNNGSKKPAWAGKSRPGRFLPMTLYDLAPQVEILTVHAEFLHAITAASALREGIQPVGNKFGVPNIEGDFEHQADAATWSYLKLWDSINAARENGQYAAIKNPAVWVITYLLLS